MTMALNKMLAGFDLEILPYIGVGPIKFGMTMERVRDLWGQPDCIEHFRALQERPQDRSVEWIYKSGVQLSFDSDDHFLLGAITIDSHGALLNGVPVVGADIQDIEKHFPELRLDDDFEENGRDYAIDNSGVSIWVIDYLVSSVTLFPQYDKSGNNPIWPG